MASDYIKTENTLGSSLDFDLVKRILNSARGINPEEGLPNTQYPGMPILPNPQEGASLPSEPSYEQKKQTLLDKIEGAKKVSTGTYVAQGIAEALNGIGAMLLKQQYKPGMSDRIDKIKTSQQEPFINSLKNLENPMDKIKEQMSVYKTAADIDNANKMTEITKEHYTRSDDAEAAKARKETSETAKLQFTQDAANKKLRETVKSIADKYKLKDKNNNNWAWSNVYKDVEALSNKVNTEADTLYTSKNTKKGEAWADIVKGANISVYEAVQELVNEQKRLADNSYKQPKKEDTASSTPPEDATKKKVAEAITNKSNTSSNNVEIKTTKEGRKYEINHVTKKTRWL